MIHIVLRLLSVVVLLWLSGQVQRGWLDGVLLAVAAVNLATIPPSLLVLRERLGEIQRGELDEARKY